ncbi:hypothetical protein ACFFSW_17780 [Saccharothrix longispora]|uniref:Hydrophobic W protein n=1 Tax=Saccharothrix longispora TaxID=33920 RepID=A0ABU1PSF0_9PSEU|nr:hypothetical protein [Saccharothrix longispora]MDR6593573.1 hypothetical protein [Saccharothrix longispora]
MRAMRERRTGAVLGILIMAVAMTVVSGPAAQAGVSAPKITASGPVVPSDVSAQAEITVTRGVWSCRLSANNPNRWWGGNGGGVQGFGSLTCSHVMPQMEIVVGLLRNNVFVDIQSTYDVSDILVNAGPSISPYSRATYQIASIGAIEWPDGIIEEIPQVNSLALLI